MQAEGQTSSNVLPLVNMLEHLASHNYFLLARVPPTLPKHALSLI